MYGRDIRRGTVIGGQEVIATTPGTETVWHKVNRNRAAVPAGVRHTVTVLYAAGASATFGMDERVNASGYVDSLPAGRVASKLANNATRVRAHHGKWRGETVHGMRTAEHDLIAGTNMYDYGRVNGTVGATR
jgi:hypothetical protein